MTGVFEEGPPHLTSSFSSASFPTLTSLRIFFIVTRLMSRRTLMSYLVLSRSGEINKFLCPGPGYLSGGSSHWHTPSWVKTSSQFANLFF